MTKDYWGNEEYKVLIEFLRTYDSVFRDPIDGKLQNVVILFNIYSEQLPLTLEQFELYLQGFNRISDNAIELVVDISGQRIKFVDSYKVNLVRGKLLGITNETGKRPELKDDLSNILEVLNSDNDKYEEINKLINQPTAKIVLSRARGRLMVPQPFLQVCTDPQHCKVLSRVCLSRTEINSTNPKQIFPSIDECYVSIDNNSQLFSKEIYKCSRSKVHHLPIINTHTEVNLGDCSYLDTCHKMKNCRYLHYFTLSPPITPIDKSKELERIRSVLYEQEFTLGYCFEEFSQDILPPQWINCDVRKLPFCVLGKFSAIVSDPAWDIHMSLPYGTCSDAELMELPMHELQDEGIMLLWVTGRSIEIGRKALKKWGYVIRDEVIWIKLNQLKRTIVTGRTGHWLNHSKEHLLVGLKGQPPWINNMIDINTIVSNTRETSRKPDEVYDMVERIVGVHARKLEIFGRDHNIRPGWMTIGNQVTGTSIIEEEVLHKYNKLNT